MGICCAASGPNSIPRGREVPPPRRQENYSPRPVSDPSIPSHLRPSFELVCPNDPDHAILEQDLRPLLAIDHDNNLNQRYKHLYQVDQKNKVGANIKKTFAYKSRVPLEEIKKIRNQFWGSFPFKRRDPN